MGKEDKKGLNITVLIVTALICISCIVIAVILTRHSNQTNVSTHNDTNIQKVEATPNIVEKTPITVNPTPDEIQVIEMFMNEMKPNITKGYDWSNVYFDKKQNAIIVTTYKKELENLLIYKGTSLMTTEWNQYKATINLLTQEYKNKAYEKAISATIVFELRSKPNSGDKLFQSQNGKTVFDALA